jgi:Rrf2 family iron-sulfur cluster assembly transcriptional regulator
MSTKGRIAVTALIDMAMRDELGPVRLTDIAVRQQVSLSYLEQLFSKLRLRGLVISTLGPHGGYELGRRKEDITVTDIILAVDNTFSKEKQPGTALEQDIAANLWDTMSAKILSFAQTITLGSLVIDHLEMGVRLAQKPPKSQGVLAISVRPTRRPRVPNLVPALGHPFQSP